MLQKQNMPCKEDVSLRKVTKVNLINFNREIIVQEIGKRIRRFRRNLDITQLEMAERAGIHRAQLGSTEAGSQNASFDLLYKISKEFNISLDWLVHGRGVPEMLSKDYVLNDLDDEFIEFIKIFKTKSLEDRLSLIKAANLFFEDFTNEKIIEVISNLNKVTDFFSALKKEII